MLLAHLKQDFTCSELFNKAIGHFKGKMFREFVDWRKRAIDAMGLTNPWVNTWGICEKT